MDNQKVTPVTGAGFDPAYVPGLTSPAREAVAEDAVTDSDEVTEEVTTRADAEPEDREPEAKSAPDLSKETPKPVSKTVSKAASKADEDADAAKPALEAKDRRGSISVDATGVRFTLDDQECDFTWDEISAVEVGTSRKRLTVTVHTPNSRWYPNDVEAPDKARLKEWSDTVDKALDEYFED
ncbi:hypothetical protein V2W30_25165 [Streptomyces sp. Q6]|uniref:Uncharacterized protein n=1 Tax=Streptomyces citrinus TaxID=3118173 RepID=A0ACD5AGK0_9ACTN